MTSRDFTEYPNADAISLEEIAAAYIHGGRKPFSPIAEVEEEEYRSETEESRHDMPQGKRRDVKSPPSSKATTSPKHSSVSPPSYPTRSPSHSFSHSQHPHPPPPSFQPPPLPTTRIPTTSKPHPSYIPLNQPSHQDFSSPSELPRGRPQEQYSYPANQGKGGFSWRGQPMGKVYSSEGHYYKERESKKSSKTSPGAKQFQLGQDGYTSTADAKVTSKIISALSEHSSLENTLLSSEASTPIGDPWDRGSPSGASSPCSSTNGPPRQYDPLQASSSDTMLTLSQYRRDITGETGLESKSETRLHQGVSIQRSSSDASKYAGHFQHSSSGIPTPSGRHYPSRQEQSSLASVSYNYQPSSSWARQQQQKSVVALRVAQFNQNGNHSGDIPQGEGQGRKADDKKGSKGKAPSPKNGQGGRADDRKGAKGVKTPSPKDARSPEGVASGSEEKGRGQRGGKDLSPTSSTEELAMYAEEEENTDSTIEYPLMKPEAISMAKPPPHYQKPSHPPPPPPPPYHYPPSSHLHPPQGHPYPQYSQQEVYTRPAVHYDTSPKHHPHVPHEQVVYTQKHPYGYRVPPDYHQRSHDYMGAHPGSHVTGHRPPNVQYGGGGYGHSMLPRPEHHSQRPVIPLATIALAHEAASKGDVATLHHLLTNHEIDLLAADERNFTLAHEAAMHGHVNVLSLLVQEGGLSVFQMADENFTTPAVLSIQGGHVECLQWLVEEGKVPLEVEGAGGETLVHHAAFHGQVKCLEWLLKTVKKREDPPQEILDDSGVTPAHFAAQGGHMDCLQLLIDYGYSVIHPDRDNQKPVDWADATGQIVCVRYLMMFETCWALSADVARLVEQIHILQKQNEQLHEAIGAQEQEYQLSMGKLQQHHEERIVKMREQYVDLTASLLKDMKEREIQPTGGGGSSGGGSTSKTNRSQVPVRKAPEPSVAQRRSKPPLHPDSGRKRGGREESDGIDYRTATPQEVLEKQMTSVAQRVTASREQRKKGTTMASRAFSPLSPIIQRVYGNKEEEGKGSRSQRHTEPHRSAPKVKFSSTVTEFPAYRTEERMYGEESSGRQKSSGHSPSHSASGHGSSGHGSSGHGSSGHSSSGHGSSGHGSSGHSPSHSSSGHKELPSDRSLPDGDSGHGKHPPSDTFHFRKSSEK